MQQFSNYALSLTNESGLNNFGYLITLQVFKKIKSSDFVVWQFPFIHISKDIKKNHSTNGFTIVTGTDGSPVKSQPTTLMGLLLLQVRMVLLLSPSRLVLR